LQILPHPGPCTPGASRRATSIEPEVHHSIAAAVVFSRTSDWRAARFLPSVGISAAMAVVLAFRHRALVD
jgi:hypothetical protein